MKFLEPSETFIVSCTNKQLQIPGFRKKYKKLSKEGNEFVGNWFVSQNYDNITKVLNLVSNSRKDIKCIVIDRL